MKRYLYDIETKRFTGTVDSDEPLENSTEISPFDADGQAKIGTWFDVDNQVWKAPTAEPTQDQQMLAKLTKQIMELQVANVQQQKVNASLTKQLMDLNKGGN